MIASPHRKIRRMRSAKAIALALCAGIVSCRTQPLRDPSTLQQARQILDSVGIRTCSARWDPADSSVWIELDTARGNLDSLARWDPDRNRRLESFPLLDRPADCTPFRRLLELLGARTVRIVAMLPRVWTVTADGKREPGPITPCPYLEFGFQRASGRVEKAQYKAFDELDELIDPATWHVIERRTSGLRLHRQATFGLAALDSSLSRWLQAQSQGDSAVLPAGARRSGATLVLDTSFPGPWCKGIRVGDEKDSAIRRLGEPSFVQEDIPFYKADGFEVGLPKNGIVLLAKASRSTDPPQDLLPRVTRALRARESIDTIPFWDRLDSGSEDGSTDREGIHGLRTRRFPRRDSTVIEVFNDASGILIDPDPPRHRVWIRYVNQDLVADRMLRDWSRDEPSP